LQQPKKSAVYWSTVRRELDVLYAQMVKTFSVFAEREIPLQYRRMMARIQKRIAANRSIIK
jgi:hypothetical protein